MPRDLYVHRLGKNDITFNRKMLKATENFNEVNIYILL